MAASQGLLYLYIVRHSESSPFKPHTDRDVSGSGASIEDVACVSAIKWNLLIEKSFIVRVTEGKSLGKRCAARKISEKVEWKMGKFRRSLMENMEIAIFIDDHLNHVFRFYLHIEYQVCKHHHDGCEGGSEV